MKKFLCCIAASLISFTVQAQPKIYVSAGGTYNMFDFRNAFQFNPNTVDNTPTYDQSFSENSNHTDPTIAIGIFNTWREWIYGLEFETNFTNFSDEDQTVFGTYQVRFKNSYNIFAKIGLPFSNGITPYVLAGAVHTNYHVNFNFSSASTFAPLDLVSTSNHYASWNSAAGFGLDVALNAHWHADFQYVHVFMDEQNTYFQHQIFTFLGNLGYNHSRVFADQLVFKIAYVF